MIRSFVLGLPGLRERIGPVKASSLRVASRIANTLRAGYAVADLAAFDDCPHVLICVPDAALRSTVEELAQAPIDWAGRTVVLCDTRLSSAALKPLAALGAYTASIDLAPGPQRMIVADGHRRALSEVKPMIGRAGRLLRVEEKHRARYYRALELASLCGPLAALAGEHLKTAGLSTAQAKPIVQAIFLDAVRDYLKSGRKVLSGNRDPGRAKYLERLLDSV